MYFLDLEKDAGTLDSLSLGIKTSLKEIQKAQYMTEQSMEKITPVGRQTRQQQHLSALVS